MPVTWIFVSLCLLWGVLSAQVAKHHLKHVCVCMYVLKHMQHM